MSTDLVPVVGLGDCARPGHVCHELSETQPGERMALGVGCGAGRCSRSARDKKLDGKRCLLPHNYVLILF